MAESVREKISRKIREAVTGTFGGRKIDAYAQGDPARAKRIVVGADGNVISGPYKPDPTAMGGTSGSDFVVNDGPDHIDPEGNRIDRPMETEGGFDPHLSYALPVFPEQPINLGPIRDVVAGEPAGVGVEFVDSERPYNHFGPGNGVPAAGSFSGSFDNHNPSLRLTDAFVSARDGNVGEAMDPELSVNPGISLEKPKMA